MNKTEFIQAVAKQSGLTIKESNDAVNAMFKAIAESLHKGEPVSLIGFGTFTVRERKARTGRNPQTGATIKIAARKYVHFKPGKGLDLPAGDVKKSKAKPVTGQLF